ncbi:MAG: methyltransferase domain-containing protein [Gammaproteobacteria bacterium]
MSRADQWRESLRLFFAERAKYISRIPTLADLCFISGRDPRLWLQPSLYEDLVENILDATRVGPQSSVLEVGCASGFIARGLAPEVGRYTGVDLAQAALAVARKLKLGNAQFSVADGTRLPFETASFDAAFCYDVVTNFPEFASISQIVTEMWRVARPGGRVLVGSVPDEAHKDEYVKRVAVVGQELDQRHGPVPSVPNPPVPMEWLIRRARRWCGGVEPTIVCYYFRTENFLGLGSALGARTEIIDIQGLNPYRGLRFNVIYEKPLQ